MSIKRHVWDLIGTAKNDVWAKIEDECSELKDMTLGEMDELWYKAKVEL